MKTILYIDACVRKEDSRTRKIADAFFENIDKEKYEVKYLDITCEGLKPLLGDFFEERQKLLDDNNLEHPRFHYAHEFANVDEIVIAAPFWDLSFPAIVKIYIENVSVDGITFTSTAEGLKGLCKAENLIYFTSRGGFYHDATDELAIPHLKALCNFFGIDKFTYIDADGMDVQGFDSATSLKEACDKASTLAKTL